MECALQNSLLNVSGLLLTVCRHEAIRTGFMLSQGGEFAFVLLSLANKLHVLPEELNRVLIIVVVLSMALTPTLAEGGKKLADRIAKEPTQEVSGVPCLAVYCVLRF